MEKVSTGTIVRTICLVLALFNQIMIATGHAVLPIDDEMINTLVSTAATVVAAIIAWWKNNSFSPAAIKADKTLKQLRAEKE